MNKSFYYYYAQTYYNYMVFVVTKTMNSSPYDSDVIYYPKS